LCHQNGIAVILDVALNHALEEIQWSECGWTILMAMVGVHQLKILILIQRVHSYSVGKILIINSQERKIMCNVSLNNGWRI
jgi:hypothetical protein